LKFFTYVSTGGEDTNKPNKFEYNEEFRDQRKNHNILNGSDSDSEGDNYVPGPNDIPDDTHFFFILTKRTLFALNHYSNSITKTYKSL